MRSLRSTGPGREKGEDPAENKIRAQNIRLKDVLAICAALNVSPAHMLAPFDDDQYVRIVPGMRPSIPDMARGWIAGRFPLGESDEAEWTRELPPEELLRKRHAETSISQEELLKRLAELLAGRQQEEPK